MAIPQQHESQPAEVQELASALAEMVNDEPIEFSGCGSPPIETSRASGS